MKNKSKKISKYYRRTKKDAFKKSTLYHPIEKLKLPNEDKLHINEAIKQVSNIYGLTIEQITGAMFSCMNR